jgi:hypothetical protein
MKKILLIAFVVSLVIAQFAIIMQLKNENERCDRIVKHARFQRDSVWAVYNPSEWMPGNLDSTDSGPYRIRTDQIKDGTIVKPESKKHTIPIYKVEQEIRSTCYGGILKTYVWFNDSIVESFYAWEVSPSFYPDTLNNWFVPEINDSIKTAHMDLGNKVLVKYKRPANQNP